MFGHTPPDVLVFPHSNPQLGPVGCSSVDIGPVDMVESESTRESAHETGGVRVHILDSGFSNV
jgi:hypothetical protein